LEISQSDRKHNNIKNLEESLGFLENYRWSSYLDYIGIKNFPSILSKKLLNNTWGSSENYKNSMKDWLISMTKNEIRDSELEKINDLLIEK
jgi:putative transposase